MENYTNSLDASVYMVMVDISFEHNQKESLNKSNITKKKAIKQVYY